MSRLENKFFFFCLKFDRNFYKKKFKKKILWFGNSDFFLYIQIIFVQTGILILYDIS